MRTFKLTLAYDGTHFGGWQWQPNRRTVQDELEKALEQITGVRSRFVASGRTDAGVHALGQVAAFSSETKLSAAELRKALDAKVPEDIYVFEVTEAPLAFHPIRDAVQKRYRYVIQDGPLRDIFDRQYAWHVRKPLDENAMREASKLLLGQHDFASFQTSGSSRLTTIRTVLDISVERVHGALTSRVHVEVEADGFLFNMVRNIVGTLVEVGKGTRPIEWTQEVLQACDRRRAGVTAPAQGLFMIGVHYDEASLALDRPGAPDPRMTRGLGLSVMYSGDLPAETIDADTSNDTRDANLGDEYLPE